MVESFNLFGGQAWGRGKMMKEKKRGGGKIEKGREEGMKEGNGDVNKQKPCCLR